MEQLDGENNKEIHGIKGNDNDNKPKKCLNCGLEHPLKPRDKCPAYGSVCLNCHKDHHWARVCRSRNQGGKQTNRENPKSRYQSRSKDWRSRRRSLSRKRRDGEMSDQLESITFESITVDVIGPQSRPANEVFVTVNIDLHSINSRPTFLRAKLDTGAQGNILPLWKGGNIVHFVSCMKDAKRPSWRTYLFVNIFRSVSITFIVQVKRSLRV